MKLRIISIFLTLSLLFMLTANGLAFTVKATVSKGGLTLTEEKVYCKATMDDNFAEDRVLVVLNNAASISSKEYTANDFPGVDCASVTNLSTQGSEIVMSTMNNEDRASNEIDSFVNNNYVTKFNKILCLELQNSGKKNVLNAIKALEQYEDVLYAGPDYVITAFGVEPNDPYIDDQWAIDKIHLPDAWEIETGDYITVGVLDTGIDGNHPELSEIVDVDLSADFTSIPTSSVVNVTDPNGHGTMVAGIIAAQGNNLTGISGVSWDTWLVSLRVLDDGGYGYSSYVVRAIDHAMDCGIPILNFSGGFYGNFDEAMYQAIDSYDGLFICAAGNEGLNCDNNGVYPANFDLDNLITVGASTSSDQLEEDSNYGATTVDLFAPGANILTCFPINQCNGVSCDDSICHSRGYHITSGTSFAAPFVTGVAALILSKYPDITPSEIKERILNGVDIVYTGSISVFGDKCVSGGRLNAYRALHDHIYTTSVYDEFQHKSECSCGVYEMHQHSWETITMIVGKFGQTYIAYRCVDCLYIQ